METISQDTVTKAAVQVLTWIASGSLWEVIAKFVVLAAIGGAAWWLKNWIKRQSLKAAQDKNQADRVKDQSDAYKENHDVGQDAADAENDVKKP